MIQIMDGQVFLSPAGAAFLDFVRDCADDFEYLIFLEGEEVFLEELELLGLL